MRRSALDWSQITELIGNRRSRIEAGREIGELDPDIFGHVSDDESLYFRLVDLAAQSWRGRRYLNKVSRCLRNAPEGWIRARAKYIEKVCR